MDTITTPEIKIEDILSQMRLLNNLQTANLIDQVKALFKLESAMLKQEE